MKITKTRLREIIKEELLNEFTSTSGGTAGTERVKSAEKDTATKISDKKAKKSAWDIKKAAYDTKSTNKVTKRDIFAKKDATRSALDSQKYRSVSKAGLVRYSSSNTAPRLKGFGPWIVDPAWTTADNERQAAARAKTRADSEYDTASSEKTTAQSDYDSAVDKLTATQKAEKAAKAATDFGFSAGAGGRAGGKGGTAKSSGKKGGKKGGKKDESLFRILGRDIINELNDIEKYK